MDEGATLTEAGEVTATFHKVESFPEFSSEPGEQTGFYFPFHMSGVKGDKMTLKKNGVEREDKKDIEFDPDIVVRLEGKTDTLEIIVDSDSVGTLTFKNSTFNED